MYPYFRMLAMLIKAHGGPLISMRDETELKLRVWPSDIDFYPELNNGRHLTIMDLGRIDLVVRSGLFRILREKKWGLSVGGASVRYRHRLQAFRNFTLRTRILGLDERWFYFHQKTERGERTHSAALIRAGITSPDGLVPVSDVLRAAGEENWKPEMPNWVSAWIKAENLRPWP
ncbi:MAG: thioesterase family protein [Deltaproteobacteria bacterium]|nr:thioesterase family protein [Deltaproteobacteria bacterium]